MNPHLVFVFVAIVLPFAAASYGPAYGNGVEDLINAAGQQQGSLTAAADVGSGPGAQPGLAQANAQLQSLNASPNYHALKNSDSIAESLAENSLATNMRQGNINLVAPNVVGQTAFRSLLVPNGLNNHQVIATQPLQPIIVNQPGAPPAQISSGPPAVVRAAPVVYKLKPSIIYQQEVINKVPTPLSLNPVYVKVYKPGKHVDAPVSAPAYAPAPYGGSAYDPSTPQGVASNDGAYGSPQYAPAPPAYGAQPAY